MLKWTLGHKLPTPGPIGAEVVPNSKPDENVHFARRRKSCGVVRKATVRALKRQKEDKENQPVGAFGMPFHGGAPKTPLQDLSNSPDPYFPTPRRQLRRRPSHPLRFSNAPSSPESKDDSSKVIPSIRRNSDGDIVDSRRPSSTLKTAPSMQIEYSPGPLIATQSLISLRRRLTKSIIGPELEKSQNFLRETRGPCVTIVNENSPTFESLLEEKSLFDQIGNKSGFLNTLRLQNSKLENSLMCSLSQKLQWLRLNNSLGQISQIESSGETNQGIDTTILPSKTKSSRRFEEDEETKRESKRLKDCDNNEEKGALRRSKRRSGADLRRNSCCDKLRPKTDQPRPLMGLTLPLGIPSPAASDDSGLCSLGLEGIQPLNLSPIRGHLTEAAVSGLAAGGESPASTSLLVNKFSPFSNASSANFNKLSSSSLGSSLRKRLNDEELELNATAEELIPMIKTPRLGGPETSDCAVEAELLMESPLAMVEKRSRSRRCLRFVSPGCTTRRRTSSAQALSATRLRDSKLGGGEIELRVYSQYNMLTIQVGKGTDLHKPGGRACNAYAKVALVPSSERTFFRTPVQRESSCPNFDEKFSFELQPEDLNKRILVSVWHRDRENRKSEFLGCVSLSVKNAVKKEISGFFRLAAQSSGSTSSGCGRTVGRGGVSGSPGGVMARRSECSSVEEVITVDSEEAPHDDSSFLRHLELEPSDCEGRPGRTIFTTTKILTKTQGAGYGLSIAWTQPPRIERVEAGQAADRAGICPGDYVIFVDKHNVVTKPEDQVLQLIKSCGNEVALEIYRKSAVPNGLVESAPLQTSSSAPMSSQASRTGPSSYQSPRSGTACSGGTASTSYDLTKRRLHLPHVAFSSESATSNAEDPQKRTVHQLLSKEQSYAVNLQFGVNRFLLPLTEKNDFLNSTQHHTLFQNIEELLRLSEDIIEQAVQEDMNSPGSFVGRLYLKRIGVLTTAYRRYCSGIKRADCLLVETSKNSEFTRFCSEPAIPKRRPDLTTFLHKPLEHYRDLLKLTSTILNQSKSSEDDHYALSRVVHELHTSYREWTSGTGIMEPEVEGRPLLSVQDLESRLVFTRCKPFILSAPGRQWIFGGDLSRVEGRAVRPFWALLFTDMMVFAKVSRDRVLFITEEPLSLISVSQAFFNIRKRATEFRLLLNSGSGTESPANATCAPDLVLNRTPRKNAKCRSIALRAPTPELKAVWQNLLQRQIIYLNTTRGGTPASSPLESPDPPTTLSVGTLDSLSLRRQIVPDSKGCLPQRGFEPKEIDISKGSTKQLNELIDHKCRQLGKTKTSKGGAMHLAEWMKGQLGNCKEEPEVDDKAMPDPEPEIWSQEELKRRTNQLQVSSYMGNRNESRCEELDLASERSVSRNTEISQQSFSTSESLTTVKSNHVDKPVSVCRQCRATCLKAEAYEDDDFDDNWGSFMLCSVGSDPFAPAPLPAISVLPPTPDKEARRRTEGSPSRCISTLIQSTSAPNSPVPTIRRPHSRISEIIEGDEDEDTPDGSLQSSELEPPYRTLSSSLRRFGTLNSLDRVGSDDPLSDERTDEEDDDEEDEEEDPPTKVETQPKIHTSSPDSKRLNDCAGAIRCSKTYPEVIQPVRSWVAPAEVAHPVRGWTARAGSFVAEKMALFERLSAGDTTTVRKTSFLERYLRPNGDTHLDSPPEPGTNTSSSGRGEDEGETSGATSGEEVWGTPTSGGEVEEELIGESSALTFMDSPHGSSGGGDDDTEQLMEDLLISLPMLAARAPGIPPRRRLEPLPEEDDTESSSAPCSPKPLQEIAVEQGRVSSGYQMPQHHDNCPEFGRSSTARPLANRKDAPPRPRIGTIDRALGIQSDEEDGAEDDGPRGKSPASPSFLHRLGLRKNREEGRKSKLLGFLSSKKDQQECSSRNSAAYGGKPLFKYLFNRDTVDDIPTTLPTAYQQPSREDGKQLERRFWKQLSRRRSNTSLQPSRSPQVAI